MRFAIFRHALAALLLTAGAYAQQLTGTLEGTVADHQEAVIPDASVTAVHNETNSRYTSRTNGTGRFRIPNARLGAYTVTTELQGFKRSIVTGVRVEVGSTSTLMIQLELGEIIIEVTVTAEAAQAVINLVDAELSTTVDNRRVLELPLNGRNAAELAMQQAGVFYERSPNGQGDKFFVHGQRHRSIQISLDGIDTQDNYNKASSIMIDQPLLALAAENVQEFKVITGIASAEYSRGGAQISAVTRSGGNHFHGSLFSFNRNDAFSANDFFNNSSGVDTPQLNRNQFGGRLGGPIQRDRTFFYLGYQQTRQVNGVSTNRTVYTAEARQGIFRYLDRLQNTPANVAANPGAVHSVNLLDCGPSVSAALGRDCVDQRFNGTNPASLDPFISGTVFGAIPLPNNFDSGDGLNTGGYRFNAKSRTVEHLPSVRLDHRIADKHNFYATLNYVDREIGGDFINNRLPVYPSLDSLGDRVTHSKGISAALTSTFNPTFVNEARFGFLGGENAFLINQPFDTPFTLDLNTITDPYDWDDNDDVRDNRTVHLRNVSSWVKGKHQIKFGVEWRERFVDRYDFDRVNAFGAIGFDDNDTPDAFDSTGDLNTLSGAGSVNSVNAELARDMVNNLTGFIGEVFQNYNARSLDSGFVPFFPERRTFKNHEFDWFVNDQWQVKPNFTVNLGIRWEYSTVPYETNGLALAPEGGINAAFGVSGPQGFFNPGTFSGAPCGELGALPAGKTTANAVALIRGCATPYVPATSSNGRPLWNDDFNNFGPVASIAWDPFGDGKTSIRAGFRISYIQDAFSLVGANLDDNEGLEVRQSCITSDGGCLANPRLLRDVLGGGPPLPPQPQFQVPSVRSILDSSVIDFRAFDQDIGTSYYNEWTFGISREIFDNWAFEARYIGNRGVGLRRMADFNEINVDATDSVTGQTFRDSFVRAQGNLDCNRRSGEGNTFLDTTSAPCIVSNPLMAALVRNDASRLGARAGLRTALERNETGQFVHRLTQVETSRPSSGQGRIRGGSFWGEVLDGRFPANFFQANPFVASARSMVNDGSSTYHAVEFELRRRFSSGFSLQTNYTFGRAISDYDGDENTLVNAVRPSSVRFPRSVRGEFAPRHLFKANWIYELPFGAGKSFLNQKNLAGKILGGWQFGGIVNWRAGRPRSFVSGVGTFHRSAISDINTVNLSRDADGEAIRDLTGRRDISGGVFWIDPCTSAFLGGSCSSGGSEGLFTLPEPGELGRLGQSIIFGPRRFLFDFSLSKRTRIGERTDVEFRWEVFNAFNNTNLALPQTNITNSNFGQITGTVTEPRVMQFALKVNF